MTLPVRYHSFEYHCFLSCSQSPLYDLYAWRVAKLQPVQRVTSPIQHGWFQALDLHASSGLLGAKKVSANCRTRAQTCNRKPFSWRAPIVPIPMPRLPLKSITKFRFLFRQKCTHPKQLQLPRAQGWHLIHWNGHGIQRHREASRRQQEVGMQPLDDAQRLRICYLDDHPSREAGG